jgi:serine O-acetyltransferase
MTEVFEEHMFSSLRQDLYRCGASPYRRLRNAILNPAIWALIGYRFRHWVVSAFPRPIRWLLAPITLSMQFGLDVLTQIQFSVYAKIGPGLYLPHLGTIVIGSGSVIGRNCTISHGVTIGHAGGRSRSGLRNPLIGDRVYIGPGAIVIGPITIGDDALIGAGAVVVKSVPPRGVVAGNPARLLGLTGSFDLIENTGTENDADVSLSKADTKRDIVKKAEEGSSSSTEYKV